MTAAVPSVILLAVLVALSGCARPTAPEPAPAYDPNVDVTPGWNEKEPDTCHAGDYGHLLGQPLSLLPSAGISRAYRVVAPGSIVTQEYDSSRINVLTDDQGLIIRLSCG